LCLFASPAWSTDEVWVFYRAEIPLHAETVAALSSTPRLYIVPCPVESVSGSFLDSHPPAAMIALGERATQRAQALPWRVPLLTTLFDPDPSHCDTDPRLRHLDTRPPFDRQIALLRQLCPHVKNVWLPYVSDTYAPGHELRAALTAAGITPIVDPIATPRELPTALKTLARPHTAGILPPDPGLINKAVVDAVLLAAFAGRSPVIGFSEALVRQGAIFAFALTPTELAGAIHDLVQRILSDPKQAAQRLHRFERWRLIINATVLGKLGLHLDPALRKTAARVY